MTHQDKIREEFYKEFKDREFACEAEPVMHTLSADPGGELPAVADFFLSRTIPREEVREIIGSVKVEGNKVGNFELGEKVMDFANELLNEYKTKTLQALNNKEK